MEKQTIIIAGITILIAVILFGSLGTYIGEISTQNELQTYGGGSGEEVILTESQTTLDIDEIGNEKFSITSSEVNANNNTWMEFDGVNDVVNINTLNDTNFNITESDSFTISVWVNPLNCSEGAYNRGLIGVTYNYILDFGGGCSARIGVRNSSAHSNYVTIPSNLEPHQWYNFIGIFNDSNQEGNISMYLNGALNITEEITITGLESYRGGDSFFSIGSHSDILNGNGVYFEGSIDEVRIYNRSLSQSEITEIYNSGRVANSSLPSDGLVLWYAFDEATGSVVYDKSNNGNHGE